MGSNLYTRGRGISLKIKKLRLLVLVLFMLAVLPTGASANTIVLTAVNDVFLPLTASAMPVRRSGEWYVPYTALESFAISASQQENGDVLVMQNENTTLTFSLSQGYVYDHNMNSFSQPAYEINSTIYVPVKLVCGQFGLSFSLITGEYQVLRIVDDNAALADHVFVSQMAGQMEKIVDTYKGVGTVKPPRPTPPPDTSPEPVPPERPVKPAQIRPALIYVTFAGAPTEYSADLLDTLAAYGRQATFFLPIDLTWDADFVRRTVAEGHMIGLLAAPEQIADTSRLTQSNAALFDMTGTTTRMLSIAGGSDLLSAAQRDAIAAAGYRLWDATITADDETNRADQVAGWLLRSFDGTTATTVLSMHHTRSTNAALTLVLRDLRVNGVATAPILSADTPINKAGELR